MARNYIQVQDMQMSVVYDDGSTRTFPVPTINPEFFHPIGKVVTNWAVLDGQIWLLIEGLLPEDDPRRAELTRSSFRWRRSLVTELLSRSGKAAGLDDFKASVDRVTEVRQGLCHSLTEMNGGDGNYYAIRFIRENGQLSRPFTCADLEAVVTEIMNLNEYLHRLKTKLIP